MRKIGFPPDGSSNWGDEQVNTYLCIKLRVRLIKVYPILIRKGSIHHKEIYLNCFKFLKLFLFERTES